MAPKLKRTISPSRGQRKELDIPKGSLFKPSHSKYSKIAKYDTIKNATHSITLLKKEAKNATRPKLIRLIRVAVEVANRSNEIAHNPHTSSAVQTKQITIYLSYRALVDYLEHLKGQLDVNIIKAKH